MEQILKYFPTLSDKQRLQFSMLGDLYKEWNEKINVISRKDIDALYEHHVLHSLAIAKFINFVPGTKILDVGTGGGFPGIPLAILFPQCHFCLIDSIGKKIKVATEIANSIGLQNISLFHKNVKEERQKFDFVVSRAVMEASSLLVYSHKNISQTNDNEISNGIICLKGGDLTAELKDINRQYELINLSDYFNEDYFETKKILYIPR